MDSARIFLTCKQVKRYFWGAAVVWTLFLAGFWLVHVARAATISPVTSGVTGLIWLAGIGVMGMAAKQVEQAARLQHQAKKTVQAQTALSESLYDSIVLLGGVMELDEALDRILENVARVVPYDTANIILFEEGIARIARTRGYVERGLEDIALNLRFPVYDIPSFQKMMAQKEPLVVTDTQTDPDWVDNVRAYGPRSYAGAPIILKEETIGFLNLNSNEPGFFTQAQAAQLGAFAAQAAVAIRNAQMYEKLRESETKLQSRLRQQAAVARLGQMALTQTDLALLFDETVAVVAQVLEVEFCKILEQRPDEDSLLLRAGVGWQEGLVGQAMVGTDLDSQAGYTLLSNEPVIVTDLATDTRFSGPPLLTEHGVVSGVSIIIQGRERPFGVLGAHTAEYRRFTQDDVNFLRAVAHILAAAVSRAEIEEALRQHIQFLSLLNDITRTAASSLSLAEMLQNLADQLGELFGADGCYITLWDEEQQKPLPAASYGPLRDRYPTLQAEPGEPTMTESVIRAGRPLVAEDVFNTPYISRRIAEMFPTRSMLGLPLVAGGQKLGAALISFHQTHHFTPEEIARGEQSVAQIALAIARVRLLEEVQRQAAQLEQLVAERTLELEDVAQTLRQTQAELVRQEKMAILGQLAGSVAHELRNPLGAMRNAVYALNMLLETPEPDVANLLDILNSEIDTSISIIGSLLAYASHQPPLPRPVDANEIARQTAANMTVPAHIQIVYRLDQTLPLVYADPALLTQAFSHILRNAVQAVSPPYAPEENGRITIQTKMAEPDTVAVSFTDTGAGIPPENMNKLFEPLFSTKAKGIGLGLPLAKTMIENQNGRITASSEAGKGAVFTVYLPVYGK